MGIRNRLGGGWRWITFIITLGILLSGLYIKFEQRSLELYRYDQRERVTASLLSISERLEASLNNRLFLTHSIESYVHARERITGNEFRDFVESLLHNMGKDHLRSLQIAQGTTIKHVYPEQDNDGVLGLDLLTIKGQAETVRRTIAGKQMVLAGPLKLIQGGTAVVARKPIFIGEGEIQKYWGLATVIINWETLLRESGISSSSGLEIALRGKDGLGESGSLFYGDDVLFRSSPVMVPVTVPGGEWMLAALPREGWIAAIPYQLGQRTLAGMTILMILFSVTLVARYPRILREKIRRATDELAQGKTMLERRVEERTAELLESEQRMRHLIEALPFPVVVSALQEDKCFYANGPALALFEETSGEQVNVSQKYYAIPEQRQQVLELLQRDGRVQGLEVALKSSKGNRFWALISVVPMVYDGAPALLAAIADISERKKMELALADSEHKLRIIFDSVQMPMAIARRSDGVVLRVNEAAKQLTGITDKQLGVVKAQELYCNETDREKVIQQLDRHGNIHDIEVCLRSFQGDKYTVLSSATYIDYEGEPCILSSFIEITERKFAEQALHQANQEAERAIRIKNEFLATMSHEIRTPLNGMLAMLQLLSNTPLTPEQQEYVTAIDYSGESLLTLLNDVLDLSKIEAGMVELEETDFDVQRMLEDMVRLMKPRMEKSQLQLHLTVDQRIPNRLRGDPTRIRQVLFNLLGNAIKFTEAGVVELKASYLQEIYGRVSVKFSVHDTGIGIPQQAQKRLFENFTQADSSVTRRYGGTGLGLAICRRMVEIMGGQIGVVSEEGKGSEFWFRLELARDGKSEKTDALASTEARSDTLLPFKVLLVEDEAINRRAGTLVLRQKGAEVVSAADGYEALERFRDGDFDVVLMDVRMPGMDGFETTRRLRALEGGSDVPVFALTADTTSDTFERCLAVGMRGVITKPLRLDRLIEALAPLQSKV